MLPGLRRLDAFGVTNGAGVLDLGAYPLLVGVAQTAVRFFDAIGEGMNVDASILADGPPGSLDAKYRGGALAIVGAQQHADAGCESARD